MNAQPGPMVSGSHFFPKAPLLWVKWMPARAVMSRKVMCSCADAKLAISRKDTTHRRETKPHPAPEGRLRIARRFSAGETGQPERVPEGRLKFSRALFSP